MNKPLVSICLPNLNTRPFLEERMDSLLSQSFTNWELIVSDNYSNDGSWELLQKYRGDPRIQLFQTPRRGMYANWNECLRRAKGEYVYVATSDDTAKPELLERLIAPLELHPELKLSMCDFEAIDEESRSKYPPMQVWQIAFYDKWLDVPCVRNGKTETLLHACFGATWVTMTAVLFRRSLLDDIGYFRTDCGSQADYEWALRASLATDIGYVPGRLATWRVREGQATSCKLSPKICRVDLDLLEGVLHDEHAGIPESWKRVAEWDQLITSGLRASYLQSFGLWRRQMWEDPSIFFRYGWRAIAERPDLFWRQLRRGFGWDERFRCDRVELAHKLLRIFDADWPPRLMREGEPNI